MSNNFNFTCKILDANLNNKYQCKNKSYIIKLYGRGGMTAAWQKRERVSGQLSEFMKRFYLMSFDIVYITDKMWLIIVDFMKKLWKTWSVSKKTKNRIQKGG